MLLETADIILRKVIIGGECRRYPPQVWCESNPETTCGVGCSFPEMKKEEWCGEFKLEGCL